ncbi:MAG: threonine ammonia-lyase [Mycobacteriales bacterium]
MVNDDPAPPAGLVTLTEIETARDTLRHVVRRTPLEGSRPLAALVGGPVYLKCENLQRAGSFKIRGAYLRISRLSGQQRANGVVAASAGNHAQGVALAGQLLGTEVTVYMPHGASIAKVEATRAYGATVAFSGTTVDEALKEARAHAERTGAALIHPFDHRDIITGQGTIGLEILEQCPDVRTIVVATGGGGLVAGIAAAVKPQRADVTVYGVQAAAAAAYPASIAAGHPVRLDRMATMADGIAIASPGVIPLAHVRAFVDEMLTVPEDALSRALLLCLERAKMVVEPAGAASVAAVMERPERFEPPVVAVLSGGNIDPILLLRLIQHGMIAAGRYLDIRVRVPDRPGNLAGVLQLLGENGGNVLDVVHSRTGPELHLGDVEIELTLETRSNEHARNLIGHLRASGYIVIEGSAAD